MFPELMTAYPVGIELPHGRSPSQAVELWLASGQHPPSRQEHCQTTSLYSLPFRPHAGTSKDTMHGFCARKPGQFNDAESSVALAHKCSKGEKPLLVHARW